MEDETEIETEFDRVWMRVAAAGGCDSPGGAEYHRVRAELNYANTHGKFDGDIEKFIRWRANLGPYGEDELYEGDLEGPAAVREETERTWWRGERD